MVAHFRSHIGTLPTLHPQSRPLQLICSLTAIAVLLSCIFTPSQSAAKKVTADDLVNIESLYWLVIFSVTFVQGAANGLFSLLLKRFRFMDAGYRWTEAFWSGFPIAFINALLVDGLSKTRSMSAWPFALWIALFLCLNVVGIFIISKWAAREI